MFAGKLQGLKWLQQQLEAKFEMKTVVVGHSREPGVVAEGKILNRVVRATPKGWEYESDQRHAEIIIQLLELEHAKILSTPGADDPKQTQEEDDEVSQSLPPDQATLFRAVSARGNFMSQDRSDVQYNVKE